MVNHSAKDLQVKATNSFKEDLQWWTLLLEMEGKANKTKDHPWMKKTNSNLKMHLEVMNMVRMKMKNIKPSKYGKLNKQNRLTISHHNKEMLQKGKRKIRSIVF